jgi:hypothetical protein
MLAACVLYGMLSVWLETPYVLWLIANWLGTAAQAYVTYMVITLNRRLLPEKARPGVLSMAVNYIWATILLVYFFAWTILDRPF